MPIDRRFLALDPNAHLDRSNSRHLIALALEGEIRAVIHPEYCAWMDVARQEFFSDPEIDAEYDRLTDDNNRGSPDWEGARDILLRQFIKLQNDPVFAEIGSTGFMKIWEMDLVMAKKALYQTRVIDTIIPPPKQQVMVFEIELTPEEVVLKNALEVVEDIHLNELEDHLREEYESLSIDMEDLVGKDLHNRAVWLLNHLKNNLIPVDSAMKALQEVL